MLFKNKAINKQKINKMEMNGWKCRENILEGNFIEKKKGSNKEETVISDQFLEG